MRLPADSRRRSARACGPAGVNGQASDPLSSVRGKKRIIHATLAGFSGSQFFYVPHFPAAAFAASARRVCFGERHATPRLGACTARAAPPRPAYEKSKLVRARTAPLHSDASSGVKNYPRDSDKTVVTVQGNPLQLRCCSVAESWKISERRRNPAACVLPTRPALPLVELSKRSEAGGLGSKSIESEPTAAAVGVAC